MAEITESAVRKVLEAVIDPATARSVVAQGMVGGFPQTSLFRARGPRTGLPNVRLVGDSIFPGQSTAGVTLGAQRVVQDVMRTLPKTAFLSSIGPV